MDPRFGTGIPIGEDTTMITTDRDDYHDISNGVFVSYQTLRGSILDDTFFSGSSPVASPRGRIDRLFKVNDQLSNSPRCA